MSNPFPSTDPVRSASDNVRSGAGVTTTTIYNKDAISPQSTTSVDGRVPPPQYVLSNASTETDRLKLLVHDEASSSSSGQGGVHRYVVYGDTDDDADDMRTHLRVHHLLWFWGSCLAILTSVALLASAVLLFQQAQLSSSEVLAGTVAITVACISIVLELNLQMRSYGVKMIQWSAAKHAVTHVLIAVLSFIAFAVQHYVMGACFLFHIVPASIFYLSKLRREKLIGGTR